jgi:hypothetical protein
MNPRAFFLFFTAIIPIVTSAQDTTKIVGNKNNRLLWVRTVSPDSLTNPGRNEISLNIIPVAHFLMGGYGYQYRLTAMYKRVAADYRSAWRFGVGAYNSEYAIWGDDFRHIYLTSDSTRTINQFSINGSPSIRGNFGYEWRAKGRRKLQTWFGADIIAGGFTEQYILSDYYEIKDSTGNWRQDFVLGLRDFEIYEAKRSFFFQTGVSVNAGLRYALNRYFLINFQTGADAFVNFGRVYQQTSRTTLGSVQKTNFDFHIPGILNEVALVFRF